MIGYFVFGAALGLAAYFDFKYMKIPDLVLAALWVFFVGLLFDLSFYYTACAVFAIMYLVNALSVQYLKTPIMSWGDILAIPPFMGVLVSMGYWHLALAGWILPIILTEIEKKERAVIPFLFGAYLIGLIASII